MAKFTQITTTEELNRIFEKSKSEKVILFKHSLTCPISSNAYSEVSQLSQEVNLIVVQTSRDISNAVAEDTGIRHESPQLLILENEEVVYQTSHYDIRAEKITDYL